MDMEDSLERHGTTAPPLEVFSANVRDEGEFFSDLRGSAARAGSPGRLRKAG
jgi:hypothetical protein